MVNMFSSMSNEFSAVRGKVDLDQGCQTHIR